MEEEPHSQGVGEVSMGMEDMALVESEEEEDEEEEGEEVLVNPLEEDEDASEEEYQKGLNLLVYAKMGDTQAVNDLLDDGVPINFVGDKGISALHVAAANKQEEVGTLLLKRGADVSLLDEQYECNAAHYAATSGCCRLLEALYRADADFETPNRFAATPMHLVGNREACETMRNLGLDLDIRNRSGRRPIHGACRDLRISAALFLIEHSDYFDAPDDDGNTPLHFAALSGSAELVEALLNRGAIVDATNNQLQTPLHMACERSHENVINLLLKHGAKTDIPDMMGRTPKLPKESSRSSSSYETRNYMDVHKEGFLTKEGGNFKTWKKRWFVLNGDTLKYYKNFPQGEKRKELGVIDLNTIQVVEEGMRGKRQVIWLKGNSRTWYLLADHPDEEADWLNVLRSQIDAIRRSERSGSASGVRRR